MKSWDSMLKEAADMHGSGRCEKCGTVAGERLMLEWIRDAVYHQIATGQAIPIGLTAPTTRVLCCPQCNSLNLSPWELAGEEGIGCNECGFSRTGQFWEGWAAGVTAQRRAE